MVWGLHLNPQGNYMPVNTYELTYILDGVLSEEEIKDLVQRVSDFITKNEGDLIEVDEWGMKQLAYPINKRQTGYYVNVYYSGPAELPSKLERAMRINERVIRYLTLAMDAKMLRHRAKGKAEAAQAPAPEEAE